MKFSIKLKELRTEKGLSRKELANQSGLSPVTIEKYEQGSREPDVPYTLKLANALNVDPLELIETLKIYQSFGSYLGQKRNEVLTVLNSSYPKLGFKFNDDLERMLRTLNLEFEETDNLVNDNLIEINKNANEVRSNLDQLLNIISNILDFNGSSETLNAIQETYNNVSSQLVSSLKKLKLLELEYYGVDNEKIIDSILNSTNENPEDN